MDYDAIVVGAGPAGSTVAEIIAKEGYEVLILEEHPRVGLPQHCTGKISVNALMKLNLPREGIMHEVRGAVFHSPDLHSLSVQRDAVQAYIFNRAILDEQLADRSIEAGAILMKNARALNVSVDSQKVEVLFNHKGKQRRVTARIIIGADGASSLIARRCGLNSRGNCKIAIQREIIELRDVRSGFVEVYLGRKYAPGFFGWIVPTGRTSVRVGLCIDSTYGKHLLKYFENFITGHPIAAKKCKGGIDVRQTAHIIPTGGTLNQTVSDGVVIVGDAAGQMKSTTGGGLYYGMVCAKIAGQTVSEALSLRTGILRRDILMNYQNRWRKRLGREIATSAKIRCLLDSLTDDEVNYCFQVIRKDEALIDMIEAEGDIDQQSRLTSPLLRHMVSALIKRPQLLYKLCKSLI